MNQALGVHVIWKENFVIYLCVLIAIEVLYVTQQICQSLLL